MDLGYFLINGSQTITPKWGEENANAVIDLDKIKEYLFNQWKAGENKDGQPVGFYTPYTESIARSTILPKRAGEPYNLMWSGELFEKIVTELNGEILSVDSDGNAKSSLFYLIKQNALVDSPDSIFGLNNENLQDFFDKIIRGMINNLMTDLKLI